MSNKVVLELKRGERIAQGFIMQLGVPFTSIVVAGSIRRQRPFVHDVDIVFGQGDIAAVKDLCHLGAPRYKVRRWGPKLAAIIYCGVPFDLYFSTPETFATLLLIRTGSKENNIRLCSIARARGWKLHASGDGLFNGRGERIAGDSERSIYDALGVPWQEPWERG